MKPNDRKKMEIVGYRLCAARMFYKLSQADLAKKVGCSQKCISKLEAGETVISAKIFFKLCNLFYLDPSYFDPDQPGIEHVFVMQQKNWEKKYSHIQEEISQLFSENMQD